MSLALQIVRIAIPRVQTNVTFVKTDSIFGMILDNLVASHALIVVKLVYKEGVVHAGLDRFLFGILIVILQLILKS